MSRAFVREDDGSKAEVLPEHPVSAAPNLVTARGLRLISAEIETLNAQLAAEADAEHVARLRRDLRYWNLRHATARIVTPDPGDPAAQFGARVTYRTSEDEAEKTVTITGEDEADPANGTVAYTAPLARALIGVGPGGEATLRLGPRRVEIEVSRVELPTD
ncbi:GreA/GreB family elongation factor [Amaricoccus sp.]|uniref:GreA/GreB family elongation factor n=1 Tax=Amaricoccus sp. TaxID=1872485 RepID=UPI002612D28F|nr:GreA/GreB family elongation factor [uncultured Amaricoccus sp.]